MKTILFAMVTAAAALAANADDKSKVLPVPLSKMAEFNAKTGGLVDPPANAKALVFLDARAENVPEMSSQTSAAEMTLGFAIDYKKVTMDAKVCPRKFAFDARKDSRAGAVVLFFEREGEPVLSAYPEDAVVLVNVLALRADKPDKKWYSRRTMTEFWRAIAFAMGGYTIPGKMGGESMQPIFSLKDYERLNGAGLSPMQQAAINNARLRLGIYSRNAVPYSRACHEGWAPAPTNDVQKSIYQRSKDPISRFKQEFNKDQAAPQKK